jgi:hypothetical protein
MNRPLNPQTLLLCEFLGQTRGGFFGLLAYSPAAKPSVVGVSTQTKPMAYGRRLYPELAYLCELLRTKQKLW